MAEITLTRLTGDDRNNSLPTTKGRLNMLQVPEYEWCHGEILIPNR